MGVWLLCFSEFKRYKLRAKYIYIKLYKANGFLWHVKHMYCGINISKSVAHFDQRREMFFQLDKLKENKWVKKPFKFIWH